jgi:hypothetical protein
MSAMNLVQSAKLPKMEIVRVVGSVRCRKLVLLIPAIRKTAIGSRIGLKNRSSSFRHVRQS